MAQKFKGYLGAFVVGGVIGVIGQALMNAYIAWQLPHAVLLMIFTLAVIGGALSILGMYPKISAIGGMGADVTMCGLAAGIALVTADAYARGASPARAAMAGLRAPAVIFGIGGALALVCVAIAKII